MELGRMRCALAVAEHGHVGLAAELLDLTLEDLEEQLGALEAELGVSLFTRRGPMKAAPTAAGEAFAAHARRALASASTAVEAARRAARGDTGRLDLGFVPSAMHEVMPALLRRFRTEHPEVVVEVHEMSTTDQGTRLDAGHLDAGVLRPPIPRPRRSLTMLPMVHETLNVFVPEASPLAARRAVPVELLADVPLVLVPREREPVTHDRIIGLCRRAGFEPLVGATVPDVHAGLGLVAAGYGVTLGPSGLATVLPAGVVDRLLVPSAPLPDLTLVWRDDSLSPALVQLLAVAQDGAVGARVHPAI